MLEVLTDPNGFFERMVGENIYLRMPIAIVLVLGLAESVNNLVMFNQILPLIEYGSEFMLISRFGSLFGVLVGFIGTLIIWVIYSGLFYLLSMPFKGKGSFKRVLELVSYGFIPIIAGSIIGMTVQIPAIFLIPLSTNDLQLVEQMLLSNPLIQISVVIELVFTLWAASIWISALSYARNLSLRNAALVVGIPVGLHLIHSMYIFSTKLM